MKTAILGTISGLLLGILVGGYGFLGENAQVQELRSRIHDAQASLASTRQTYQANSLTVSNGANQTDRLADDVAALRKQLEELKTEQAYFQPINPVLLGQSVRNFCFEATRFEDRLSMMKVRLKLTPDQVANLRSAMAADVATHQKVIGEWLRNGNLSQPPTQAPVVSQEALVVKSALNAQQQTDYQAFQTEQWNSHAELMATVEVNNMVPLLELSDEQKEQAMNAVYQAQVTNPDPLTDPDLPGAFTAKMRAIQASFTQVLTPQQRAIYQQQAQVFNSIRDNPETQN